MIRRCHDSWATLLLTVRNGQRANYVGDARGGVFGQDSSRKSVAQKRCGSDILNPVISGAVCLPSMGGLYKGKSR
jgi:hypothetical protein